MAATSQTKPRKLHLRVLQFADWQSIIEPQNALFEEILQAPQLCEQFLNQFSAAVRTGALCCQGGPRLRLELLALFEHHCNQLCSETEPDRIRHWYESVRDRLACSPRDPPEAAVKLRDAALRCTNNVIIALNLPSRDPRLVKFHVEYLFRILTTAAPSPALSSPAGRSKAPSQSKTRRKLALECLHDLQIAFPNLLYKEAAALLEFARQHAQTEPSWEWRATMLAATVVSDVCAFYLKQQEEEEEEDQEMASSDESDDSSDASFSCSSTDNSVLVLGGDANVGDADRDILDVIDDDMLPKKASSNDSQNSGPILASDLETAATVGSDTNTVLQAAAEALCNVRRPPNNNARMAGSRHHLSRSSTKRAQSPEVLDSPSGVLLGKEASAASALTSHQSSRRSMLTSVLAADSGGGARDISASPSSGSVSALTSALRTSSLPTTRTQDCNAPLECLVHTSRLSLNKNNNQMSTDAVSSASCLVSPRSISTTEIPSELPLLQICSDGATSTFLRRFTVPRHVSTKDFCDAPRLIMTPESRDGLESAAAHLLTAMRRMDPHTIAAIAEKLPPVLKASRPSSNGQLWPLLERHLTAGSTPLLRAVLDVHDAAPCVFEGRSPSVMEKVLRQANDISLSQDHRMACVTWALRQHARQRHAGAQLLLGDGWAQLVPLAGQDSPQLAATKVKGLAACIAAGVGDVDVMCRGAMNYFALSFSEEARRGLSSSLGKQSQSSRGGGHGSSKESKLVDAEQRMRAMVYALRQLETATHTSCNAIQARGRTALLAAVLQSLVNSPGVAPAIDTFLATCPSQFATALLRALNALMSCIDGQFEVLQERPEDALYERDAAGDISARVKAALLSRSASLSGLLRGLSFQLSFSKRSASVFCPQTHASRHGDPLLQCQERSQWVPSSASSVALAHDAEGSTMPPIADTSGGPGTSATDVGALRAAIAAAFTRGSPAIGGHDLSSSSSFRQQQQQQYRGRNCGGNGEYLLSRESSLHSGASFASAAASIPPCAAGKGGFTGSTAQQARPSHFVGSRGGHGGGNTACTHVDSYLAAYSGRMYTAPCVPELLTPDCTDGDADATMDAWLASPSTWHDLAPGILRWDLLAYRHLLQRVLRCQDLNPRGTLRTLANYTWQYKEHHPNHALSSDTSTAGAILALCETVALARLPRGMDDTWNDAQRDIADAVLAVIDALEDGGFPAEAFRPRCRKLSELVQDEGAWGREAKADTLGHMLCGHVDAAIDGLI